MVVFYAPYPVVMCECVTGNRIIAVPALAWSGDFYAGYDPNIGTAEH